MPNFAQHLKTGVATGSITAAYANITDQQKRITMGMQYQIDWNQVVEKALVGSVCGGFGGILPYLLEPAVNPNHRNTFHSLTVVALLLRFLLQNQAAKQVNPNMILLNLCGAGYLSHLVFDAETPKGLPVI